MEPIVQFTKDRRNFWAELNQTRELGVPKMWKDVFPEATNINFHSLLEANQYNAAISNKDEIIKGSAHLPGVVASYTTLPVIGIPIDSSCLNGMDSLLSIVQMPPGIPVATMSIGKGGARNAGIYAASILAIKYPEIKESLNNFRQSLKDKVKKAAEKHNK